MLRGGTTTGSGCVGLLKITRRLISPYGSQRSMITFCGLLGNGARRSITTLRGGGGIRLPEMVILLEPMACGGMGGASRTISGSGVVGRAGC